MYSLNDLQKVKMHGDNMEAFLEHWDMTLRGLKVTITDEINHDQGSMKRIYRKLGVSA